MVGHFWGSRVKFIKLPILKSPAEAVPDRPLPENRRRSPPGSNPRLVGSGHQAGRFEVFSLPQVYGNFSRLHFFGGEMPWDHDLFYNQMAKRVKAIQIAKHWVRRS
jgi:hypothetical protein